MNIDRREHATVALVLLVAAVAVFLRAQDRSPLERLDWPLWDLAQRSILPERGPVPGLTVVLMDDESLVRLGERWPLDRRRWASFLDVVAAYEPATVGLDAWFETPSPRAQLELAEEVQDRLAFGSLANSPEGATLRRWLDAVVVERDADRAFSQALGRAGRVLLGVACPIRDRAVLQDVPPLQAPFSFDMDPRRAEDACPAPRGNLPSLAMASLGEVGLQVVPDADGVIRRYAFALRTDQGALPLLGTAAALASNPERRAELTARAAHWAASPPLLRFRPRNRFRTVRFSDVLEAGRDSAPLRAAFEGQAVLVGVSALGVEDLRATAIEQGLPGVFVHASAFAGLLDDDVLATDAPARGRGRTAGLLLLLLVGLAGAPLRKAGGVAIAAILGIGAWGALGLSQMEAGVAFPLAVVPLGVVGWAATKLGFEYVRNQDARRQADAVREAFQHYLAPAVVEQLVDHPEMLRLGGERRVITAFFSDVAGFTTISETLDPQELSELLNECLGAMTEVILEEGGTIDKYIGDAIVAMFGAPLDQPDHADRALRAAVRCQERLEQLRPGWRARGWPEVVVRIGVNSGPATVGNMGSAQRFDYTMLGDTVNLAARLEGANKAYGTPILVGEEAASQVSSVPLRELDRVRVKGKTRGVVVFTPEPDPARREASDEALAAYRAGRWAEARAAFTALLPDPPAAVFLARIDALEAERGEGPWDGIHNLTEK